MTVAKCEKENLQQLVADSEVGIIFKIPWGHHIQILTKCKGNRDKALYFVRQTMNNIQSFLLELGKGFAFVVIEIKTRAFEPGDMGQLGTYIVATDGILRGENDNATIGLLICKTKDNVESFYVA